MADVRAGGQQVTGDTPQASTDAGNPVKIGGKGVSAVPSAVSTGQRQDAFLDLNGRVVTGQKAATGTTTQVASSASNVTLLAANTARLGATVYNDSTSAVYVKLGATASSTSYAVKMLPASYYEVPFGYAGIIDAIWVSANGNAYVTEIT